MSLWTPGSPKWSLRVRRWNLKVSKITVLGIKTDPFQQSTCHQLPVDTRPAAEGEALKYLYVTREREKIAREREREREIPDQMCKPGVQALRPWSMRRNSIGRN